MSDDTLRAGVVVFVSDLHALSRFYAELTGMTVITQDDCHTVMRSRDTELVIHALDGGASPGRVDQVREDRWIKPFFPVASISATRDLVARLGGRLRDSAEEWSARGFRACDGADPEGNVFQVREVERGRAG